MIEKQCGPLPKWMAEKCTNQQIKSFLEYGGNEIDEKRVQ
jgi:hypothetical protein